MKRTVQMKTGNAGGSQVASSGCRHNPAKILRVVRDAVTKACGGDKERAASLLRNSLIDCREPRQSIVNKANSLLAFIKSPERVQ